MFFVGVGWYLSMYMFMCVLCAYRGWRSTSSVFFYWYLFYFFQAGTWSSKTGRPVSAENLPASTLSSAGDTDVHYVTQHLHVCWSNSYVACTLPTELSLQALAVLYNSYKHVSTNSTLLLLCVYPHLKGITMVIISNKLWESAILLYTY